jgi:3-hydroxyisobutyrate dehydrogenase
MAKIAFIGLGIMGGAMARHLAAAGHEMTVYNRTQAKADAWVAANGGQVAPSPAEAAGGADAVITCVGADDDLAAVTPRSRGSSLSRRKTSIFSRSTRR